MAQRVCEALVASLRHPAAWVELVSDDGSMRTAGHAVGQWHNRSSGT